MCQSLNVSDNKDMSRVSVTVNLQSIAGQVTSPSMLIFRSTNIITFEQELFKKKFLTDQSSLQARGSHTRAPPCNVTSRDSTSRGRADESPSLSFPLFLLISLAHNSRVSRAPLPRAITDHFPLIASSVCRACNPRSGSFYSGV